MMVRLTGTHWKKFRGAVVEVRFYDEADEDYADIVNHEYAGASVTLKDPSSHGLDFDKWGATLP